MKLLFYINVLCFGGAERVMSNLANYCCHNGNEVFFVTSYPIDQEYSLDNRVNRINLNSKKIDGFVKKNLIYTYRLRTVVRQCNPDVVVSFLPEPNFRAIIATSAMKCKVVISVRNDPSVEYKRGVYRLLSKILYPYAEGIVFQTDDAKEWFSERIQRKSRIIYNAVSPIFYENRSTNLGSGIVSVGNFKKQKNHSMLIKAFNRIKNQVDDCLYIYGDGDDRKKLEELIISLDLKNRVNLMGQTRDIHLVLKNYRLFVLSSDYEGMPNALMEAMAVGLPCISTDCPCGGPKELLEDNMNYLSPVGDDEELSHRMLYFLSNEKALSENAEYMKKMSQKFEKDIIYSQWGDYLKEVAIYGDK